MAETKATAKTMNVYQKLAKARMMFLKSDTKKTGKNMTLAFKYFELDDIVPVANKVFDELGLISLVNITADTATMTIVNTENNTDFIAFSVPLVNYTGNNAVNPVQAFGATVTYYRRYLYMIALDICEPDAIDPDAPEKTQQTIPFAKPAPTTSLTDGSGKASELQITQLKESLKKLRESDPSKEEMIAEIAVATKGFTEISKVDCEELIKKANSMLNGGDK